MKLVKTIFTLSFLATIAISFNQCGSSESTGNGGNANEAPLQGLASCTAQSNGTICGTLSTFDGTPLANAEILAQDNSGAAVSLNGLRHLEANSNGCFSDATGAFACVCNVVGDFTFSVKSALVNFNFDSSCVADAVTNVPTSVTTANTSDTSTFAVITGSFDHVEVVLANMFACGTVDEFGELEYGTECNRMHIYNGGARIFGELDPNNSSNAYRTHSDLLNDLSLMNTYDVIFFNCGMNEDLVEDATVKSNLMAYYNNGGKLYFTDWAYDYLEQAFPELIDFYETPLSSDGLGSTPQPVGEAKVGGSNSAQTVNVEDSGLRTYLQTNGIIGGSDTTADINFDLGAWVVMVQSASNVTNLLTADSLANGPNDVTNIPIASLNCDSNSSGGIFYSSYHTEIGTGMTVEEDPQEAGLRYMILNGFNECI